MIETRQLELFQAEAPKAIMTMEDCRNYKTCKAPLCPLDVICLKTAIWYPDEEICSRRGLPDTGWLKVQRRIAKRAKRRDLFYRFDDLISIRQVRASIKGYNPNHYVKS